ncbi:hypothetical protein R3I93_000261 [Phoxinus phoxinus]|uniref:Uncharacterized protein n=1 Tax=Phoxinus phoxinus TaxID=58324 RepID=A0AAN9DKL3_9TELE
MHVHSVAVTPIF